MNNELKNKIDLKRENAKLNIDKVFDNFITVLNYLESNNLELFKFINFIMQHNPSFRDEISLEGRELSLYIRNQWFFMMVIPNITNNDPYKFIDDLSNFISYITDDMEFTIKWCTNIPSAINKKDKMIVVHKPYNIDENIYPVLFEDNSEIATQNVDIFLQALKYNEDVINHETPYEKFLKIKKERDNKDKEP